MTHQYDILFCGEYVTPFSSPNARKATLSFGFSIRNEFQDESEFQNDPHLSMAKDRIIKRLQKKGYTFITITSIKAIPIHQRKRSKRGINALAKQLLRF